MSALFLYIVSAVYFFSGVGILLNLLILVAIFRSRKITSARIVFICSLTVSDIIASGSIIIVELIYPLAFNDELFCVVVWFCLLQMIPSCCMIVCMAIDLFIAVHKPLVYKRIMTRRVGIVVTSIIWAVSLSMTYVVCTYLPKHSYFVVPIFNLILSAGIVVLVLILYIMIFKALQNRLGQHRFVARTRKAALAFILIGVTFILFMLPGINIGAILIFVNVYTGVENIRLTVISLLSLSVQLNCICDPLIYATRLPTVKKFFTLRRSTCPLN